MSKHHKKSDAYVKDRLKNNLHAFISHESFSGVLLFFCVVFAMLIANSRFHELYFEFQELEIGLFLGPYHQGMSVVHFVNDVAMSFFFLMIGLEMKREILYGELAGFKKIILPMLAALGGIIVPIGIYLFFNHGTPSAVGFGVAMSTDTAFALGAILFLGKRVPLSLKVFLVTLAVVDDLGAIFVIVVFYTTSLNTGWLLIALAIIAALIYINQKDTYNTSSYLLLGVLLWIAVFNSGVHATIAAVILAFCIPGRSNVSDKCLIRLKQELENIRTLVQSGSDFFETNIHNTRFSIKRILASLKRFFSDDEHHDLHKKFNIEEQSKRVQILEAVSRYSQHAQNPLLRLQAVLHPLCSYFIVPFFAFVNAGVRIDSSIDFDLDAILVGTVLGLVVGKPLGIFVFSYIGIKLRIATKPKDLSYGHIFATGCLAGIGFTMSIFVANLAYDNQAAIVLSKISILYASLLALIFGICFLYLSTRPDKIKAQPTPEMPKLPNISGDSSAGAGVSSVAGISSAAGVSSAASAPEVFGASNASSAQQASLDSRDSSAQKA